LAGHGDVLDVGWYLYNTSSTPNVTGTQFADYCSPMNFPITRWSLILASTDDGCARKAWRELAEYYRSPILAYFRCRFGSDRAEDLTHSFFVESIAGGWWARADLDRGSFRSYLRMLLRRFGARHFKTLSPMQSSTEHDIEKLAEDEGPEAAYDRDFASTLVALALARLRSEGATDSEAEALLPYLLERGDQGELKQLAIDLGLSPNTLLQRLRRMRLRLRELLREELAQLVADVTLIDSELIAIQADLSRVSVKVKQ